MTGRGLALVLSLLGLATSGHAADVPAAAVTCAACHGAQGEGNATLGAPRVASQDVAYLERQLLGFRNGRRAYHPDDTVGATMRAAAVGLGEADIPLLASYYAALSIPAVPASPAPTGDRATGKALYLTHCGACHGMQAQGYPQQQSPNLRILQGWYIEAQVRSFQSDWRGATTHSDLPGIWMRSAAANIGDPYQLAAVIAYIDSLTGGHRTAEAR